MEGSKSGSQSQLTPEQLKEIHSQLDIEEKALQKEKRRRNQVNQIFFDDEDREFYGFSDQVLEYVALAVKNQLYNISIHNQNVYTEDDYVKVDDVWLKVAKIMYESSRLSFQNERMENLRTKNVKLYNSQVLDDLQYKLNVTKKAGEVVCTYLEINPDQFMYLRDQGSLTILEHLDPIQFLIPVPVSSKIIEELDKTKALTILNEILNAAANAMKENKDIIKVKKEQLQQIYHFLAEDILWMEFGMDFEDFKFTLMHHKVLVDQSIVSQLSEFNEDLFNFFDGDFYESD
ncbi:UNKNOWN [Stylonychia lemnae]|uniref:Uncharacterized protein n=1 Tax=Stylonychia lemnae TaxID=5949 RepID=A0A077ZRC2_STYLE|nr:UNKNOWN [Stylonychia lemnae]|eukprot:CDW71999.1 UNKNOWN [Stylonychia lemnae]